MPELSIIIPIYNVEDQLSDCLDSLINQSVKDIEIIAVNDASTDGSRKLLQKYAKQYNNINIIDMEQNSGSGPSRNRGIKAAAGKYIGFVDGDDWIDLDFYATLLHAIKEENCDIAIAGILDEYNNILSSTFRYAYNDNTTIDGKTGLKLLTKSCNLGVFITPIMNNKIYRSDFLKEHCIYCSDNKSWQDDYFSFFAMLYADKICMVSGTQYHYRQRLSSITHNSSSAIEKIDNCIDVLIKIRTELCAQGLYEPNEKEYDSFVERCISSLLTMLRNGDQTTLNDNLIYLFDKITHYFDIKKIITYLDNERIYRFFNL